MPWTAACTLALVWAAGGETELIGDPQFQRGFRVSAPTPGKHVEAGQLRPDPTAEAPLWRLAQWSSRYPLECGEPVRQEGACRWANAGKQVVVAPAQHPHGELLLGVNGSAEYPDHARRRGEPWAHLLIEQGLASRPGIASLQALRLHLEARLVESRRVETPDYQRGLHAAQFLMFLTIQNLNRQSAGYGDFVWFGIALYDDRHRVIPRGCHGDLGTGKLIYSPASDTWATGSLHDGDWVTFAGDLLPEIRAALAAAWEKGFCQGSRDLADYRVSGLNLGWEVPGTFDVAAQIRGLRLTAVAVPAP
ncbi:MAG: hypothetical protein IT204_12605 [Fimbriimonadaceae bacterium]|nr:hypothetical protein [Fimbriimonadaceae bacterium]